MKTVRGKAALALAMTALRRKGRIGFVPTMGALHEGHLALVRRAKKENRCVVVSIFVNPLQFGPKEDLARYPRPFRSDKDKLAREGVALLFAPTPGQLYGTGFQSEVSVKTLTKGLCGPFRPGHFAGVATVVLKLLQLVKPHTLYLGQKDFQQYRVIERMARDLDLPVRVKLCPTVREKDGLAMSSRNVLLSRRERREARKLPEALEESARLARQGERNAGRLRRRLRRRLSSLRGARVDYAELVDAATLEPVVQLKPRQSVLAAAAVRFSRTRLIDNRLIKAA